MLQHRTVDRGDSVNIVRNSGRGKGRYTGNTRRNGFWYHNTITKRIFFVIKCYIRPAIVRCTLKKCNELFTSCSNHSKKIIFVHKSLPLCKKVFVRVDRVKTPLEPPYAGPYEVIARSEKNYVVKIKEKKVNITIDRLKPCFETDPDNVLTDQVSRNQQAQAPAVVPTNPTHTRSGRAIKPPVRFQ